MCTEVKYCAIMQHCSEILSNDDMIGNEVLGDMKSFIMGYNIIVV